jgi:fructosamine-3-kinase
MGKLPQGYVNHPDSYYRLMKKVDHALNLILRAHNIKADKTKVLKESYSASIPILIITSRNKYFVKIADEEPIANEVYLYKLAEKHNVGMPRLLHYDLSRNKIPFTYYIAEYVEGLLPYNMSKRKLYEAGYFSGKALRKIHQINVSGFGSMDNRLRWRYKNWLGALISERKLLNETVAKMILVEKEIDKIDELTIYNKEIDISMPRLMHGDLWEGNVLYRKHPEGFVITDAGPLIGGDPLYDLAYSVIPRTAPFENGVAEGYKLDELTEKERYRLRMLKVFCLFKEAIDYVERKDARFKIDRLVKTLRAEMLHSY